MKLPSFSATNFALATLSFVKTGVALPVSVPALDSSSTSPNLRNARAVIDIRDRLNSETTLAANSHVVKRSDLSGDIAKAGPSAGTAPAALANPALPQSKSANVFSNDASFLERFRKVKVEPGELSKVIDKVAVDAAKDA